MYIHNVKYIYNFKYNHSIQNNLIVLTVNNILMNVISHFTKIKVKKNPFHISMF